MKRIAYLLGAILLLAGGGAVAAQATDNDPKKVFVCKYVGTPGLDERLQTGQNPISVSVNAIPDGASVGAFFADAQGRSYVLAFDTGQPEPSPDACPKTENPPPPPPTEPTPLAAGATFAEATCTTGPSFQFTRTFLAGLGNRPFYLVDGPLVDGRPVAGQTYTITAQSVVGFILTGQTVWTHTFAATPTNCGSTPPPPTTTTPVTPPAPRCPPGMTPTAGKDGQPGNDECEFPKTPPPPVTVTPPATTPVTPAATPPPAVTSTTQETTPAETTPEAPASSPGQPAEANPPAANSPQPKTGQPAKGTPAPKPKNKPCPPGTREHNGTCNAIVQGNG